MSWSLSATGKPQPVIKQIAEQMSRVSLSDPHETETLRQVMLLISQTVNTFDSEHIVQVNASGSMGFTEWHTKTGPHQQVHLEIKPILLTAKESGGASSLRSTST